MVQNSLAARKNKTIDPNLHVHAWIGGSTSQFILAGELTLDEHGDRDMFASFQYDDAYLKHLNAYPLDPINLPLSNKAYSTTSSFVGLGAIFDAAPDAWGRRVALANLDIDEQNKVYRNTFIRGADGIGALLLTPGVHPDLNAIVTQSLMERPSLGQIDHAAMAAERLELDGELPEEFRQFLAGSWTIGGARPKALLRDDRAGAPHGASVIVKFSSSRDTADRNRLEFAGLRLARLCGMPVPDHDIHEFKNGKSALVIERFDRSRRAGASPTDLPDRRHYVSAMSFISREPNSPKMDSRVDQATFSWNKLLEITSTVAIKPAAARVEMFARLALNAALSNTDGHLKNFGFLRSASNPLTYEIAPVFDVSPQGNDRHYLYCADLGRTYTLEDCLSKSRELGIAKAAAQQVTERLCEAFTRRFAIYDEAGLSLASRERAEAWITRGLGPQLAGATKARGALPRTPGTASASLHEARP